jgi:hypothetical protein
MDGGSCAWTRKYTSPLLDLPNVPFSPIQGPQGATAAAARDIKEGGKTAAKETSEAARETAAKAADFIKPSSASDLAGEGRWHCWHITLATWTCY